MFQVSIHRQFKYQVKAIDDSLSTDTTELSSMNVEYKKQRSTELDQFHGRSRENWQKTVTEERAEIRQMQGMKTHSARNQRRNIRKMKQGMRTQQPPQRCTYLTWTTHHSARH